jgi:NitT/TauT family transport system permease protein
VSKLFVPTPIEFVSALLLLVFSGEIIGHVLATLYRTLAGFLVACIIGIPIGLLMGYSNRIYSSLEFVVEFFRSIPATALFPLFLLVFGIGDESKIALSAWSAGLVLIVNAMYGVHLGKELRLKAAKTMHVSGLDTMTKIIFPEALPQIFTGMRVAISLSLIIVVVAEMFVGTTYGLGRQIMDAQLVYRVGEMYSYIFAAGIVGFILNKGFMQIEHRIVHWKGK